MVLSLVGEGRPGLMVTMNELASVIDRYVDREGMVEPDECWSEEDLRKLIQAAKNEIRRRALPHGSAS